MIGAGNRLLARLRLVDGRVRPLTDHWAAAEPTHPDSRRLGAADPLAPHVWRTRIAQISEVVSRLDRLPVPADPSRVAVAGHSWGRADRVHTARFQRLTTAYLRTALDVDRSAGPSAVSELAAGPNPPGRRETR
ncbi:hypothetical protein [Actinoplanes sp. NPDC049265]|uniref:hypothetical protein n=1 Tax=Actinoplanes sp. NPDC049265 TaxID=3363902 RepID=UPI003716053B